MRPMLLPGLRWAWRAPDTVQFGIDVPRPLVVTGLPPLADDLLPAASTASARPRRRSSPTVDAPSVGGRRASSSDCGDFGVVVDGRRWPGGRGLTPDGLGAAAAGRPCRQHAPALPGRPGVRWFDQLARTRVVVVGLSRLGAVVWSSLDRRRRRPRRLRTTPARRGERCLRRWVRPDGGRAAASRAPRSASAVGRAPGASLRRCRACTSSPTPSTSRRAVAGWSPPGHPTSSSPARSGSDAWGPWSSPVPPRVATASTLARRDRDPGWAQVWRQLDPAALPTPTASLVGMTAHLAASHVLEWMTGGEPPTLTGSAGAVAPEGSDAAPAGLPAPGVRLRMAGLAGSRTMAR